MKDPARIDELQALPLRVLSIRRRGSDEQRLVGTPRLDADQPAAQPVVLTTGCGYVLLLAAYAAEELALPPAEADRACAARIAAKLGYTALRVVRLSATEPARTHLWKPAGSRPLSHAFLDPEFPNTYWDATGELPTFRYVALLGTVIDIRSGEQGIRWHRPYFRPSLAQLNHSPLAPRPKPGAPIEVIREIVPAATPLFGLRPEQEREVRSAHQERKRGARISAKASA